MSWALENRLFHEEPKPFCHERFRRSYTLRNRADEYFLNIPVRIIHISQEKNLWPFEYAPKMPVFGHFRNESSFK